MTLALCPHPIRQDDGYVLTLRTTVQNVPVVLAWAHGEWTATLGEFGLVILRGSSAASTMATVLTFLGAERT